MFHDRFAFTQICAGHIRFAKVGLTDFRAAHIGHDHAGVGHSGMGEVAAKQGRTFKVCISKIRIYEDATGKIGLREILTHKGETREVFVFDNGSPAAGSRGQKHVMLADDFIQFRLRHFLEFSAIV